MEVATTTESDLNSVVPKLMTYLNPQVLFEDKGIIALPSFNVSVYFNGSKTWVVVFFSVSSHISASEMMFREEL